MAKHEQPTTEQLHPLERKTTPGKTEGTTTLIVIAVLLLVASILTLNPLAIGASIINLFLMAIVCSCLDRSNSMETCLTDIRDALNLQTIRLEIISRQMLDGGDVRRAAAQIGELKDIAEETRDMISYLQPEKEIEEG